MQFNTSIKSAEEDGVRILFPTLEQMKNTKGLIEFMRKEMYHENRGVIKLRPPEGYCASRNGYDNFLNVELQRHHQQNIGPMFGHEPGSDRKTGWVFHTGRVIRGGTSAMALRGSRLSTTSFKKVEVKTRERYCSISFALYHPII